MLADYAGVSAAACALDDGWFASTAGFEIHNIAPAQGQRLVAVGQAVRNGRRTSISRADVYAVNAGAWTLTCIATTTCATYHL
jgi:acyl-coenzyme A thioesterase PaaI-like protein